MKLLRYISIVVLFGIFSCTKDSATNPSTFKQNGVGFRILDQDGNYYFENVNIDMDNIQLYRIVNSQLVPSSIFRDHRLDSENHILFGFDCTEPFTGQNFQTVIKWNETDQDTVTYDFTIYERGTAAGNFRFNSVPFEAGDEYGVYTARRTAQNGN